MKKELYTIDSLTEINKDNPNVLPITQADVDKVNRFIEALNLQLDNPMPYEGDRIILHGKNWKGYITYEHGHIEKDGRFGDVKTQLHVCTRPMTPYLDLDKHGKVCTTASGGYWLLIADNAVKNTGEIAEVEFWNFVKGSGARKGVYFKANVKVFEYTDYENIY